MQDELFVADSHNDLLLLVDRRARSEQAEYFRERWLPQFVEGAVAVQVLPVCSADFPSVVRMIEAGHRVVEANGDTVKLCLTGADIDDALDHGKVALILALESCEALGGDPGLLEALHRIGVRMASFTHMGRTGFADGSAEDAAGSGLTKAGIEALTLMEALGILMDVSHLSAAGVDDVLARATRPVVASHSAAYSVRQHHRNLTDERLLGIAATGGVIGVNFMAGFIDPEHPTVDRLIDHLLHIGDVAGADHVGFGSDFIEEFATEVFPGDLVIEGVSLRQVIPNLGGPAGFPLVLEGLAARGVSHGDISKISGQNWLRFLRSELGRHSP